VPTNVLAEGVLGHPNGLCDLILWRAASHHRQFDVDTHAFLLLRACGYLLSPIKSLATNGDIAGIRGVRRENVMTIVWPADIAMEDAWPKWL
jgi:hypothetical protein